MKGLRIIMAAIAIIFTLLMAMITPVAWVGLLIVVFGLYQTSQKRKGKKDILKETRLVHNSRDSGCIIIGGCAAPSEEVE